MIASILLHLAAVVLGWTATYGTCADDLAAIPAEYHPDAAGYTLTCSEGPVWFERGDRRALAVVDVNTRTITLDGTNTRQPGLVLLHEVGHLVLDHRPGQAGVESAATAWALDILDAR